MKLMTKFFGEIEYHEKEVINFPEGLFGFEDENDYLLIRFDDEDDTLLSLQSVNNSRLAFVVVNPFRMMPEYAPYVPDHDLMSLGVNNQELVAIYTIAVVGEDASKTTVNLKAPLVINPDKMCGRQVMLDDPAYSFRHHFTEKQ